VRKVAEAKAGDTVARMAKGIVEERSSRPVWSVATA
jgi:hypothetical protein